MDDLDTRLRQRLVTPDQLYDQAQTDRTLSDQLASTYGPDWYEQITYTNVTRRSPSVIGCARSVYRAAYLGYSELLDSFRSCEHGRSSKTEMYNAALSGALSSGRLMLAQSIVADYGQLNLEAHSYYSSAQSLDEEVISYVLSLPTTYEYRSADIKRGLLRTGDLRAFLRLGTYVQNVEPLVGALEAGISGSEALIMYLLNENPTREMAGQITEGLAKRGSLSLIERIDAQYDTEMTRTYALNTGVSGNYALAQYILRRNADVQDIAYGAARRGRSALVQLMVERHQALIDDNLFYLAGSSGDQTLIDYLERRQQIKRTVNNDVMNQALVNGALSKNRPSIITRYGPMLTSSFKVDKRVAIHIDAFLLLRRVNQRVAPNLVIYLRSKDIDSGDLATINGR